MKNKKLWTLITLIITLNVLIYYRAVSTIESTSMIFGECARNSGRTSAAINLLLLLLLGHFGLKLIIKKEKKKKLFETLIALFAINHLVHFFFVFQNFKSQEFELNILDNLHGVITYICIIILPIIIKYVKLNMMFYYAIIGHFFNVTYMISDTFYSRYKPIDPAYLHRLGIIIMISSLLYVLYRVYSNRKLKFDSDFL